MSKDDLTTEELSSAQYKRLIELRHEIKEVERKYSSPIWFGTQYSTAEVKEA